jgi:hypothetical protein
MDHVRSLEIFHEQASRPDRIHLSLATDQLDVSDGFVESRSYQAPDCARSEHGNGLRHSP